MANNTIARMKSENTTIRSRQTSTPGGGERWESEESRKQNQINSKEPEETRKISCIKRLFTSQSTEVLAAPISQTALFIERGCTL